MLLQLQYILRLLLRQEITTTLEQFKYISDVQYPLQMAQRPLVSEIHFGSILLHATLNHVYLPNLFRWELIQLTFSLKTTQSVYQILRTQLNSQSFAIL